MAKDIGRLHSFGIGVEATPGTVATIDAWLPVQEANMKSIVEMVKDDSWMGLIDEYSDNHITKRRTEFTAKWIVRSKSIAWILFGVFGTAGAPTLVETGVYSHLFTRANTNAHPAYTVIHDNQTAEEQSLYAMIQSLKLSFAVWSQAKFDLTMVGKGTTTSTGTTPAYTTADEPFLISNMAVKVASAVAGLAGATPFPVQSVNVEYMKNLTQIYSSALTVGTEIVEFQSQHNQNFNIVWDLELVMDTETYKTLFINWTKQAMSITLTGKTLVGATKYNTLTLTFPSIVIEDWDRKLSNNDIGMQTFGFTALYSVADTSTASALIQNTIATQYV